MEIIKMGAPKKEGLNYFPVDIDIFDDPKILFIEDRFGEQGELIALKLLCWIYRNGYFCEWNSDICLVFAKKNFSTIRAELCNDVVTELVRRGFFDEGMFEHFGILTSKGIQERWLHAIKQCKRTATINSDYNLVSSVDEELLPEYSEETVVTSEDTPSKQQESRQSIINNKILNNIFPPTPPFIGNEDSVDNPGIPPDGAEPSAVGEFFKKFSENEGFRREAFHHYLDYQKATRKGSDGKGWRPRSPHGFRKNKERQLIGDRLSYSERKEFYREVMLHREKLAQVGIDEDARKEEQRKLDEASIRFSKLDETARDFLEKVTIERWEKEGGDVRILKKGGKILRDFCINTLVKNPKVLMPNTVKN